MLRKPIGILVAALLTLATAASPAQAATQPTGLKVVALTGVRNDSLRMQWTWRSGVASYELQAATDASFSRTISTVEVTGKKTRPTGGVLSATIPGLKNATRYQMRVRAISGGRKSGWSATVTSATKVHYPGKFTSVTAKPGPGAGQVTFKWQQDGTYTSRFTLETALTAFSPIIATMPKRGRNAKTYSISSKRRSLTLTAQQMAAAGSPIGSANHLYFRLKAVNVGTAGSQIRAYPYLQTVSARHVTPMSTGALLRIGTFNVRSASSGARRSWLKRAPSVAATIISRNPGIVALQELGPGRADGRAGSTTGSTRQTISLQNTLRAKKGGKYRLVRTTPYVKPGVSQGTQGARILFDSTRYRLVSRCAESSSGGKYSGSCTISLPKRPSDSAMLRRKAAYGQFQDRSTGVRFYFVSAHLDARHSAKSSTERSYDKLRESQVKAVLSRIGKLNGTKKLAVVFAGDINSWQNKKEGYIAHDALVSAGYYDTAASARRINLKYSTFNGFATTVKPSISGYGSRLDVVLVKGAKGASRFENVQKVTNDKRGSDHNLVVADIRLPR